ncbi:hypothetical protein [Faecalimicrobium sp. JNUCC 81]
MKKIYSLIISTFLFISSFSLAMADSVNSNARALVNENENFVLVIDGKNINESDISSYNLLNHVVFEEKRSGDYTEVIVKNRSSYKLTNASIKLSIDRYNESKNWVGVRTNTYSGVSISPGASKSLGKKYDPLKYGFERIRGTISVVAGGKNYQRSATRERINNPYRWKDIRSLAYHTAKHRAEFNMSYDEMEYSKRANQLWGKRTSKGYQYKVDNKTETIRVYHPTTNTFGSYDAYGRSKTYFKPSRGQAYFNDQPGILHKN